MTVFNALFIPPVAKILLIKSQMAKTAMLCVEKIQKFFYKAVQLIEDFL